MKLILPFLFVLLASSYCSSQTDFNVVLGRPTDNVITLSVSFNNTTDFRVNYGTVSGTYASTSASFNAQANVPLEVDLEGLNANTKYYYQLSYTTNNWSTTSNSPEYTFHTQRAPGEEFVFTIEADEHLYDHKGIRNLYEITLANQREDNPDFMLTLGDTFGDDHEPFTITSEELDSLHRMYRPYLGNICHSVPFYFCVGNHEGENDYYASQTPPYNLCVSGTQARKKYYPNPYPNAFYSGNDSIEPYDINYPENYYSWTWGDALFVVLDVYRYQNDTTPMPHGWDWTLGKRQYDWLKNTLETSTATHKCVFGHHVRGLGRGGSEEAQLYEWGGKNHLDGNNVFSTHRPGWDMPIHDLFLQNGVDIFFQGHDHVFAHESLDGIIYQTLPMAADSTYRLGIEANGAAFLSDTLEGSGYLRVRVNPSCMTIDFLRSYLPLDTLDGSHHNKEIAFSYTIGTCDTTNQTSEVFSEPWTIYPNPARNQISINAKNKSTSNFVTISDISGRIIERTKDKTIDTSSWPRGVYLVKLNTENSSSTKKIIIE